MSWPLLRQVVWSQRRALVGWSVGVFATVASMGALWPSVRDMPELDRFLADSPDAVRELFRIDRIGTGAGYLDAELFSIVLPAMFIVYGVGWGARLLAGTEQTRTLDVVLSAPLTRARVLLTEAVGLVVGIAALGVALLAATAATSAVASMGVGASGLVTGSLAMVATGLEHGLGALAVGAATGRRSLAWGVAGTVGVAGYVLYVLGEIVTDLRTWQDLSPFEQTLANGPSDGPLPWSVLVTLVTGMAAVALAVPLFERRDVGS